MIFSIILAVLLLWDCVCLPLIPVPVQRWLPQRLLHGYCGKLPAVPLWRESAFSVYEIWSSFWNLRYARSSPYALRYLQYCFRFSCRDYPATACLSVLHNRLLLSVSYPLWGFLLSAWSFSDDAQIKNPFYHSGSLFVYNLFLYESMKQWLWFSEPSFLCIYSLYSEKLRRYWGSTVVPVFCLHGMLNLSKNCISQQTKYDYQIIWCVFELNNLQMSMSFSIV